MTSSCHLTTNPESTNPDYFITKFVDCFKLLKTDVRLRIKKIPYDVFDHWLARSDPRNSFVVVKTFFVPFAQILEYFIILWFRTCLDMFETDIIISNCIITLKQVWTCLKTDIKSYYSNMTSLDMFVETNQFAIALELQDMSWHAQTYPDMSRHVLIFFEWQELIRLHHIVSYEYLYLCIFKNHHLVWFEFWAF